MGRGIKKISENVIADKRSLTLVTSSEDPNQTYPAGIVDTEAMPLGMLNIDYNNRGVSIKTGQDQWNRLDADYVLEEGSISSSLIGNGEVKTDNIADRAVTTEKIKDAAVINSKIADNAVNTPKIANNSITTEKIVDQAVTNSKIANDAVTTIKIKNNTITTDKIVDGAVTTPKIANKAVTTDKIADNAVTTKQIAASAPINGEPDKRIATENLQDGIITTAKLANGAVTPAKIATPGIATPNLQDYCVTKEKLGDGAVTTEKLANNSVTKEKIAPGAITLDCLGPDIADIIDRAVVHDGSNNVTGEGKSTMLNNIKATGDIYARRVYNVVYMDIAEGYEPGELLEPGDIVAMHEDGKVYKAESIKDCIVGVVSDEFAHCLGASKEELFNGTKVAVGMIGKIHVKVKGPVKLGQKISVSLSDPGIGMAWCYTDEFIGKALETIDCEFDEINTVLVQVRPM